MTKQEFLKRYKEENLIIGAETMLLLFMRWNYQNCLGDSPSLVLSVYKSNADNDQ